MKKIINIALLGVISLAVFNSCSKEIDPIFGSVNYNATAYSQFMDVESDFVVNKLNALGEAANGEGIIEIKLMGPPSTVARTVNFTISDRGNLLDDEGAVVATPATSAMYTLSSNSFTVAAGETSGSVAVTLINLELPLEETVYFDIELTSGDVDPSTFAAEAMVTLFKKDFCPYTKADLIGDWAVVENAARSLTFTGTYHISDGGDNILLFTESFWFTGPGTIWGETITDIGEPVPVVLDDSDPITPVVYIQAPQYLMTTEGIYPYWISDRNTYNGNNDFDWDFQYCNKTLTMYFYIPYDGADGGLVDIVDVTLDWSGSKKIAYVNRTPMPDFNYSKLIDHRK